MKKIKSLGIADSYNLCGALEFSEKISKVGTQPIIGTQINLNISDIIGKVSLYATSEKGYKNLTKLSSLSYLEKNSIDYPACKLNDIISNNEDLILLIGNYNNFLENFYKNKLKDFNQITSSLKKNFQNRLYRNSRHNEFQEKTLKIIYSKFLNH